MISLNFHNQLKVMLWFGFLCLGSTLESSGQLAATACLFPTRSHLWSFLLYLVGVGFSQEYFENIFEIFGGVLKSFSTCPLNKTPPSAPPVSPTAELTAVAILRAIKE